MIHANPSAPLAPQILIVDDEPAVCFTLQSILEHYGYGVLAASNTVEGLALIIRESFDVLLIDPRLAGRISGQELIYHTDMYQPQAAMLLLIGMLDFALPHERVTLNRFATLDKTASPPAIATSVAVALARRPQLQEKVV